MVHFFIINISEFSVSSFLFIICQSPKKSLRTSFTKGTFSFVILKNKFATTDIFFHTCRKHKFYEQYILYYCIYVLVEIVFFTLCYFVMNLEDHGPEKRKQIMYVKADATRTSNTKFIIQIYIVPSNKHFFLICIILTLHFDVLLTVHLSIFVSVINQLDAQKFWFTISLFHASTCFEHMCTSSGGQNCITSVMIPEAV